MKNGPASLLWVCLYVIAFHASSVAAPTSDQERAVARVRAHMEKLMPKLIDAIATYPAAKKRFLRGLPPGQKFFVTVSAPNSRQPYDKSFVSLRVQSITGKNITGIVVRKFTPKSPYRIGQQVVISEHELGDWMIQKPDGSEEGHCLRDLMHEVKD